jgi:hypothetical protein
MTNYSPFRSAVAQLHTPEAIAYYKLRSEQDAQAVAIATIKIGAALYKAAAMAYNLCAFVRALYESTKPAPETIAVVLVLPATKPGRTMVQRLDAIAQRQAERQVPSVGVIVPLTTFVAPQPEPKKAPIVSKAKKAPKANFVDIGGASLLHQLA